MQNNEDAWSVEEYIETRNLVDTYLSDSDRVLATPYDKLDPRHRKIVASYVDLIYKNSKLVEPSISKDLHELLKEEKAYLVSFEHRLKTIESLRRKVIADSKDYDGSYYRAAHNICDSIRYTIIIEDNIYIEKVDEYLHSLENMGYEVLEVKNNWGTEYCQGINARFSDKNSNTIFEIQFHTPIGYQIKEQNTRDLYQVIRDESAPPSLMIRANKLRKLLQTRVEIPENAIGYSYDTSIIRR